MKYSVKHRLPATFMPPMDLQLFQGIFVHRFLTHYSQNIVQIATTSIRDIKKLIKLFERITFENLHTLKLETENRKYPSQTSLPEPKTFVKSSIIVQMFNTVLKKCRNLRTWEISEVHVTKRERLILENIQQRFQLPLTLKSLKWLNPPPWLLKLLLTPNFPKLTKLELHGSQLEGKLVSWMLSAVSESLRYCDLKFFLEYGDIAIPVPVSIPKMPRLRILHLHGADPRYAINGFGCFPRLELISLRLCSQSKFPSANFHLELSNSWFDWNSLNYLNDVPKINVGLRKPPKLEFDWWTICGVYEWGTIYDVRALRSTGAFDLFE